MSTINKEIVKSGLADKYEMKSTVSDDHPLAKYLGKVVRFKVEHQNERNGQIVSRCDFKILQIQKDYEGNDVLRGYAMDRQTGEIIDSFGRCIEPHEVNIIH